MKLTCPDCHNPVLKAGDIKVMGNYGRYRLVSIYYCKVCHWRGQYPEGGEEKNE